jgi:hypothetical protein
MALKKLHEIDNQFRLAKKISLRLIHRSGRLIIMFRIGFNPI